MISKKPIRILVVDDSGLVRDLISSILASEQDMTIIRRGNQRHGCL